MTISSNIIQESIKDQNNDYGTDNQENNNDSNIDGTVCRETEALVIIENRESGEKLKRWLSQIENRQIDGDPMTVMEYTTILFRLQQQQRKQLCSLDLLTRLEDCRAKGYTDLVGIQPVQNNENWRLPRKVLRKASREEAIFHQALYHSGVHRLIGSIRIILADYIAKRRDILYLLALITALYVPAAFTVLVGLSLGYVFASITEFVIHRYVAHAVNQKKEAFSTYGKIGHYMTLLYTEHSVHHGSVTRHYTEIFAPEDIDKTRDYDKRDARKKQVEEWVLKQGGEPLLKSVQKSLYGLTSSNLLRTHLFFVPGAIILTFLSHLAVQAIGLQPGLVFDASVLLLSLVWVANSTLYHVYLHMPREAGLKKANPLLRWYLKTRLSNFIARSHRTHHTMRGRVNQNLTPFTDYFVAWSPINIADLVDLRKRKTFY